MNLPDSAVSAPALTAKDRADLEFGLELGVDAVALSFVRHASDVESARRLLRRANRETLVIAKIERREAVDDLDPILAAVDGVMVARGDLGVELPLESVPLLQKEILRRSVRAHVFAITATQMLESMVTSETPTRAEVSDVANAVLDGTDAVMLSAETSIGAYPVEAVATLERVVGAVERRSTLALPATPPPLAPPRDLVFALAPAAVRLAEESGARALVPLTMSGRTAALIATRRPSIPIFAGSPDPAVCRRLVFWRGVHPRRLASRTDLERSFDASVRELRAAGLLADGDVAVLVGGRSLTRGGSNMVQVVRVGEPFAR